MRKFRKVDEKTPCPHCGVELGIDLDTLLQFSGICPNCFKEVFDEPEERLKIKTPETPIEFITKGCNDELACKCVINNISWSREENEFAITISAVKTFEADDLEALMVAPLLSWELKSSKGSYDEGDIWLDEYKVGEEFEFTIEEEIYDNWDFEFILH